MPIPWLPLIDAALGVATFIGSRKSSPPPQEPLALEAGARSLGQLEARLTGVVVAALKEAFDRDTRRLELEREQHEAERQRAERALRLELRRQAGDREIGRLRLAAGVAVASWLGTLVFSARAIGGSGAHVALVFGWLLLLAAIGASFAGQSRVARSLERDDDGAGSRVWIDAGVSGAAAPWLVMAGLVLAGVAVLL